MDNENFSEDEINHRIIQENNFSGTVTDALQDVSTSGPDAPDLVWGSRLPVNRETVDSPYAGIMQRPIQGNDYPVARPRRSQVQGSANRVTSYDNPEVINPVRRTTNLPTEQSTEEAEPTVLITVRRRHTPLESAQRLSHLSEEEKEHYLRAKRAAVKEEYLTMTDDTLQTLLDLCALLMNMDVDIERKYVELDILRVFDANKEKSRFLHLTQGLGILEKYASNLIKEGRPPYWRNVKFTSSLVQVHVGRLIGSRDILSQMGYTQDISDGVAFPGNVPEPNVTRLKDLAPDLFFARYEIDLLLVNKHPFYEMEPPVPMEEVELPRLFRATFPPSRPQPFPPRTSRPPHPVTVSTGQPMNPLSRPSLQSPTRTGYPPSRFSPTPSPRRPGGKEPIDPLGGKEKEIVLVEVMQEPQHAAERNNESEGDSEYEDAEDGILSPNSSSQAQVTTNFECRICGESVATKFCKECKDTFCVPCDGLYHKHASRQHHARTALQVTPTVSPSTAQPVVGSAAVAAAIAAAAAPVITPQSQRAAASSSSATSAGDETRPRPRPVPAPRRSVNLPPSSNQGVAQGTKKPESKEEECPPPIPPKPHVTPQTQWTTPTRPPVQHSASPRVPGISSFTVPTSPPPATLATVTEPPSVVGTQRVGSQPVVTTAANSQAQSQRREILRPPTFVPNFNTAAQQSSLGAKDEKDSNATTQDIPPPLPPRMSSPAQPKTPVESKLPRHQGPTSPDEGGALSCPNCYCLNSAGAKTCLFCKKPLPIKAQKESTSQPLSPRQQEFLETRNYPPPIWAMSPEQGRAVSQMQQSQGSGDTVPGTRPVISSSDADQLPVDSDKWQCEHCTYHNSRARKICEMCCRTSSIPLPPRNAESPTADPVSQPATPRQNQTAPSQNVTNMAMQINKSSQQIPHAVHEPTRKPEPPNLQAALTGTPARPPATWEGPGRAIPTVSTGPPLPSNYPGVTSPGQRGVLDHSGVVPGQLRGVMDHSGGVPAGPVPPLPARSSPFPRDAAMPYGYPPPPASFFEPMGMTGSVPEINSVALFPAPVGNSFLHHLSPGFPQTPPTAAWPASPADDTVRRQQEEIYISGMRYVEWLKKAEMEGFTAEEVNIASILGIDDPQGPIHWLQNAWYDLIHRVMILLCVPENSQEIGNIGLEEVRDALIDCTGDVSRAVSKCMENRKKKVKDLQQAGVYAKTDCINALDTSEGDTEKAILALEKMSMRPMLQRVLNSCLPDNATQEDVYLVLTRQMNTQTPQDRANFEAIVKDIGQDMDRRIRAVLAEKDVTSWGRAEIVIKLIDKGYGVDDSVEAARNCRDLQRCLRYLKQECPLCCGEWPMSQMITFLHCQDRVCQECVSQFITFTIKEKNIMHLVCPVCGKPDNLDDEAVAAEYFNNFDIMTRGLVDSETHDLFQRKLRDRTLMKEPNFRWCSHCSSGFINEQPGQIRMMCPHCQRFTCFKCKRQWEDQHQGITCEQFAAWKEANDPEFQAHGLAAHLKRNGIECPNCKYRYDLSKGGCMHFKCAMCRHEFCSGCYNPFVKNNTNAQNCRVSEHCTVLGLHAHHPRDCYFYLRDQDPEELQKLLRDNNVAYNTEPPEAQGNASDDEALVGAAAAAAPLHCKVNEQKETVDGLVDAECGVEVQAGYAGLCRKHYVEYLVVLINDNLLDPADIMSSEDLGHVLRRGSVEQPPRPNRMQDDQYHQLLLQAVKDQLPLPPKPPRKRILDDEEEVQPVQNIIQDEDEDDEDDDVVDEFLDFGGGRERFLDDELEPGSIG